MQWVEIGLESEDSSVLPGTLRQCAGRVANYGYSWVLYLGPCGTQEWGLVTGVGTVD